jgi:hypothetical protein
MQRGLARLLAVVVIAACTPQSSPSSAPPAPSGSTAPSSKVNRLRPLAPGESNIARADYIGPEACGECHGVEYAAWTTSLHRVMNAKADAPKAVIGDFSGAVLRYAGGEARFDRSLTGYAMTVTRGERTTRYRITRTIGKAHLQEYVGVEEGHTDEVRLPFGY